MCVVSNIGDHFGHTFPKKYPDWFPEQPPQQPFNPGGLGAIPQIVKMPPDVSREEFDALKKEVQKMKRLLKNAKEIDEVTGQPDCEMEAKVALLKQVAKLVGVNLGDVFGPSGEAKP